MNTQNQGRNVNSDEKMAKESGAATPQEGREAMQGAQGRPDDTQHARKGSSEQSADDISSDDDEDLEMDLADSDEDEEEDEIDLQGT